MALVTCPGCRTTLNVNVAHPGQHISCSLCKTLFQMPAAPAPPLATPVAPLAPRAVPLASPVAPPVAALAPQWQADTDEQEQPVDRSAFALSDASPEEEAPIDRAEFTLTRTTGEVMHAVRVETVIKEAADGLLLAVGINVVAVFITALAVGALGTGKLTYFLVGYAAMAVWLGVLVLVGYAGACLKQRRRPDLVYVGAVAAIVVGGMAFIISGASFAMVLIPSGGVTVLTVLLFMVAETITIAISGLTSYMGLRAFRALQRPEVIEALNMVTPPPRQRRPAPAAATPPAATVPQATLPPPKPPGAPPMPPR